MYLSIDFEDFNHDLKRSLGIWKTGCLKSDVLWEKYNLINVTLKDGYKSYRRWTLDSFLKRL